MNLCALRDEASRKLSEGRSHEEVISFLRSQGCSKTKTIFLLRTLLPSDANEVARIVHFSETWSDRKNEDEQFEEKVFDVLENMGFPTNGGHGGE